MSTSDASSRAVISCPSSTLRLILRCRPRTTRGHVDRWAVQAEEQRSSLCLHAVNLLYSTSHRHVADHSFIYVMVVTQPQVKPHHGVLPVMQQNYTT